MRKSRVTASTIAERALRKAIDEETATVRGELGAQLALANARIINLEAIIRCVKATCAEAEEVNGKIMNAVAEIRVTAAPEEPQGQTAPLDEEDDLGPGRWV